MIQQCAVIFVLDSSILCLMRLTDYTNLFSPNDLKKNDDIILKYFGL